ncbi:MAG: GNAT family N-acetyltransferase [Gemmatimonadaceae bacterium]
MNIHHDPARHRFWTVVDGGEAELTYKVLDTGAIDLRHTGVPAVAQGRGVGDALVRAAVNHARGEGVQIIPSCPFVVHWLTRHPEARDLVRTSTNPPQ